jgi:hypothetical protein
MFANQVVIAMVDILFQNESRLDDSTLKFLKC